MAKDPVTTIGQSLFLVANPLEINRLHIRRDSSPSAPPAPTAILNRLIHSLRPITSSSKAFKRIGQPVPISLRRKVFEALTDSYLTTYNSCAGRHKGSVGFVFQKPFAPQSASLRKNQGRRRVSFRKKRRLFASVGFVFSIRNRQFRSWLRFFTPAVSALGLAS